MIWTYKEAAKAVQEHLNEKVMAIVRRHQPQMLAQIPKSEVYEGDRHGISREDGSKDDRSFIQASGTVTIKSHEDRPVSLKEAELAFEEMALSFAKDMGVKFFQSLDAQLQEAGRATIHVPLTADSFMDMIEGMWIEFDSDGQPHWPTMHGGQAACEKMELALAALRSSPVHLQRMQNIIIKKHNEWADRQNSKFLAD